LRNDVNSAVDYDLKDGICLVDRLKHGKGGKAHIHDLKNVMHSVKVLPKGIYGITSSDFGLTHAESAKVFLDAGVKILQYREKKNPSLDEAKEVKKLCHAHGAIFIVNDWLDIAIASNADGVHLGQEDTSIEVAKKQFRGMIGISTTNLAESLEAQEKGADYLGVGSMFATDTKSDAKIVSFEEFRRIRERVTLPLYAIGGIKQENVRMIKRLGAEGAAVISGVLAAKEPRRAVTALMEKWNES